MNRKLYSNTIQESRPLGSPTRLSEDNSKTYLKKIGYKGAGWTSSVVGSCKHGNGTVGSVKAREFLEQLSD
jgi:hypothetical protein